MGEKTEISWCDSTVNPVRGCDKVSEGCKYCYITTTVPFRVSGQKHGDPLVQAGEGTWNLPFKLNLKPWICDACGTAQAIPGSVAGISHCEQCNEARTYHRRRIFWLSLSDWLHPKMPIEWLARMLDTVRQCQDCDHLLVTKRPELWRQRIDQLIGFDEPLQNNPHLACWLEAWCMGKAPSNVWVLTTTENQEMHDKRRPDLLKIPAVVHGFSVEPMLEPITLNLQGINWAIFGGESGPNARECHVAWLRDGKQQCEAAGVACFMKQVGSNPWLPVGELAKRKGMPGYVPLQHPKGGDPDEWPEDIRVRQWPQSVSR